MIYKNYINLLILHIVISIDNNNVFRYHKFYTPECTNLSLEKYRSVKSFNT